MQLKWDLFFLLILIILIAQILIFPHLKIAQSQPDLPLILAVYCAVYAQPRQAFWAAAVLGWCKDATNCERFGLFFFSFTFFILIILYIRQHLINDIHLLSALVIFLISLAINVVELTFLCWRYESIFLGWQCVGCAIYTMVLFIILQICFNRLALFKNQ